MKVRRYMVNNIQEAMGKVKVELGSEAFIISSRKVKSKKGILSIFSKSVLEVIAAVDELPQEKKQKAIENNRIASEREEKMAKLESKVVDMEKILSKIYEEVEKRPLTAGSTENTKKTSYFDIFFNNLIENDVSTDITESILAEAKSKCNTPDNVTTVASVIYSTMAGLMGTPKPIQPGEGKGPKVAIFIGPTGVGKTTTLAKLAGNFSLVQGKKVAMLTTDTYRISAVDQLRTYADIMGIPLTVIYSPDDVRASLEYYSDRDLILVDTAGRSHKNSTQFDEITTLLSKFTDPEVYLVLSAVTNLRTLNEISKSYSFIKNAKLIITKIDESATPAAVLNSRLMLNMPLSYVTNGQSVPDDIELANIDKIIKNLMGSIANDGSSR
jgi:flagellar biosynthetic protein FlhF